MQFYLCIDMMTSWICTAHDSWESSFMTKQQKEVIVWFHCLDYVVLKYLLGTFGFKAKLKTIFLFSLQFPVHKKLDSMVRTQHICPYFVRYNAIISCCQLFIKVNRHKKKCVGISHNIFRSSFNILLRSHKSHQFLVNVVIWDIILQIFIRF